MTKKIAVLAVNPVNGLGLFHYLEAFYENGIPYEVFAVADSPHIKTNSGIAIEADGTVADLASRTEEFDALVFACGDAVPQFTENADKPYNRLLMELFTKFRNDGKPLAGHCAAGLLWDMAGIAEGTNVAVHPYVIPIVKNAVPTYNTCECHNGFYTAQTENTMAPLIAMLVRDFK